MSTAPTSPRRPGEGFASWADRCEADILAAFETGHFTTFVLLADGQGTWTLTPEGHENDEFFFRRVAQAAREHGATQYVSATTGQLAMGPLGAVACVLWYVADTAGGDAAHGLGQIFDGRIYARHRVEPANAPRSMRTVVR